MTFPQRQEPLLLVSVSVFLGCDEMDAISDVFSSRASLAYNLNAQGGSVSARIPRVSGPSYKDASKGAMYRADFYSANFCATRLPLPKIKQVGECCLIVWPVTVSYIARPR